MLADTTQHAGFPHYLPFLAIPSIAAAQLVKILVQSLEQLMPASQLCDVVRTPPAHSHPPLWTPVNSCIR